MPSCEPSRSALRSDFVLSLSSLRPSEVPAAIRRPAAALVLAPLAAADRARVAEVGELGAYEDVLLRVDACATPSAAGSQWRAAH